MKCKYCGKDTCLLHRNICVNCDIHCDNCGDSITERPYYDMGQMIYLCENCYQDLQPAMCDSCHKIIEGPAFVVEYETMWIFCKECRKKAARKNSLKEDRHGESHENTN